MPIQDSVALTHRFADDNSDFGKVISVISAFDRVESILEKEENVGNHNLFKSLPFQGPLKVWTVIMGVCR